MASSSRPTAADDLHADSGIESTPEISQIEHNQNLEYESDGDSGYSASDAGSTWTASLSSSIQHFQLENGRTYHSYREGKYSVPNDESEKDRLDLQSTLFSLTLDGKLYLAPTKNVRHCLDVGTGTGIWAIDYADSHPEVQIIGTDLSPIQPNDVPPNLQFLIDDMEEDEWHFHQPFDFIHSRMMVGSFKDWPKFMSTAYKWLRPGGWLECQDVDSLSCDDDTFSMNPPSCALARWWSLICEAFDKAERPMIAAPNHQKRMIDAHFVDTRDEIYKWPINTWPKDEKMKLIGLWSRENTLEALEALALAPLTRILGWSKEEVMVLVAQARKDVINPEIHAYWNIRFVYGRRPPAQTE